MAKNPFLIQSKAGLVMKIIWMVIAVGCLAGGIFTLTSEEVASEFFVRWLIAGGISCIPIIWTMLKLIGRSARAGAIDGANTYTVTSSSVTNHPIRGFFLGLLGGLIAALLIGLIVLAVFIIGNLISIIVYAVRQAKLKKTQDALQVEADAEFEKEHKREE